jgi:hapalindole H/12-epi-hapalindole U/12-epi-fischerindole U synthase
MTLRNRLPWLTWATPATILLIAASPAAQAALPVNVAIANAGFEAQAVPPGAFLVGVPTGWQPYDPSGRLDGNLDALGRIAPVAAPAPGSAFFPGGPAEGLRAALVYLAGSDVGEAGLQQILASTLQANTQYTLRAAVGNIASGVSAPGSSDGGGVFYNLSGFPGYRIDLLAGSTVLASDDNGIGAALGDGQWGNAGLAFDSRTAAAGLIGLPLTIRLVNLALPGNAALPGIDFDDVRLTALAVPEPGTWALWLAGVALVAHRARRACTAAA